MTEAYLSEVRVCFALIVVDETTLREECKHNLVQHFFARNVFATFWTRGSMHSMSQCYRHAASKGKSKKKKKNEDEGKAIDWIC